MGSTMAKRRLSCPPHGHRRTALLATAFDPLAAARDLKAAGFEQEQAEALAAQLRAAAGADHADLATKADLAELRADLAETKADLYRALWIQGGAIVAILTALRFLPV